MKMQRIRVIDPDDPDKPNVEEDDNVKKYMLFTYGITVTLDDLLALVQSPKKCDLLGVDNTYVREMYGHQYEWHGWPELPPIDPNEETCE